MDNSYLSRIREIKEKKPSDMKMQLEEIANEMEDILSSAEMWNTVRVGFSVDELAENLEYIARENDI